MADTPLPTPPLPAGQPAGDHPTQTAVGADGIQAQANGLPASRHVTARPTESVPPAGTLREWAVYRLIQVAVLVGLWVVLFAVLKMIFNRDNADAVGFAIILTL